MAEDQESRLLAEKGKRRPVQRATAAAVQNGSIGTNRLRMAVGDRTAPAARAGVLPGDVLLRFDGKEVHGDDDLYEQLRTKSPGGVVMLGLSRQTKPLQLMAMLVPASRPVVVFAHIPLWSVYPDWGWGTEDSEQALGYLKRFGSVTVLNGHIHQVMQKVEGSVTFHTAMSTAFPQPAPGAAKGPGPMKVADDKLRSVLGITDVKSVMKQHSLAVVDSTLAGA